MNSGKTIFAQLMDFIPSAYEFRSCPQVPLPVQSVGIMRNASVVLPAQNESQRVGSRPRRFD